MKLTGIELARLRTIESEKKIIQNAIECAVLSGEDMCWINCHVYAENLKWLKREKLDFSYRAGTLYISWQTERAEREDIEFKNPTNQTAKPKEFKPNLKYYSLDGSYKALVSASQSLKGLYNQETLKPSLWGKSKYLKGLKMAIEEMENQIKSIENELMLHEPTVEK